MNTTFRILHTILLSVILSSCGLVGYGVKVNTYAFFTKGRKDVSSNKKFWKHIQQNTVLSTVSDIDLWQAKEEQYDYNASTSNRSEHNLEKGTKMILKTVYYESNGYTHWNNDYIATIMDGAYAGKKIRLNELLLSDSEDLDVLMINRDHLIEVNNENKAQ